MKKLISILLVAVLIIGMLPATALTAFAEGDYELATSINVGDTVTLVCSSKSMELNGISTTSTKYGLGVAYTGTPAGAYELTVEEGSTSGTYAFKTPAGTYLYWGSGNSLATNATKSANTSWTVTFNGDNAVIKNAKDPARILQWNASSPRFACYGNSGQTPVQFYKLSTGGTGPEEPECTHENTELQNDSVASCTEDGYTGDLVCIDCGEELEKGQVIPAGHNYVDNVCTVCGEKLEAPDSKTYTFSEYTAGSQYAENEAHKLDEWVTVTTTKCHFTTQLRIYSSSANNGYAIIHSELPIYEISVNAGNKVDTLNVYGSTDNGTTWELISGISVISTTYNDYSLTLTNGPYNYLKLDVDGDQQVRIASMTLTFNPGDCAHASTEESGAVAPGCTTAGKTADIVCSDCGATLSSGTPILPGHAFDNGACSVCGEVEPVLVDTVTTGVAYKMGMVQSNVSPVNLFYLSGAEDGYYLGTVGAYAEGANVYLEATTGGYYLYTMTDDTKTYINMVVDGNYVNGKYQAEAATVYTFDDINKALIATVNETSYWFGTRNNGTYTTVGPVKTADNGFYCKLYVGDGEEIPEPDCQHANTEEIPAVVGSCTEDGWTAGEKCSDCSAILTPPEKIPAPGHDYEGGICGNCGEADPAYVAPGRYYIATVRGEGSNYFYLTSTVNDKSRYVAVDSDLTALPTEIADPAYGYVFVLVADGESYKLQVEGAPAEASYLGWTDGNTGTLVNEENALLLTVVKNDGTYQISFNSGTEDRYLSLNNSAGNDYFVWYKTGQKKDLSLIPVTGAEVAPPVVSVGGSNFTSVEEALEQMNAGDVLTLLDNVTIDAGQKELNVDLAGFDADITAAKLTVTDSTATRTEAADGKVTITAGTGTLTTTAEVVMDHIDGNTRWIALEEEENTYSFHILELELNKITLRTNRAGLYYKATITCDDALLNAVENYGVLLNASGETPEEFDETKNGWTTVKNEGETALSAGKVFTSGSVFNIFKDGADNNDRGTTPIYAHAYLNLKDGRVLKTTSSKAFSMYDVVKRINDDATIIGGLTDQQEKALDAFYDKWYEVLDAWGMTALAGKFKNQ